jgi:preprotein translocase subunit SecA
MLIQNVVRKIIGTQNDRELKSIYPIVAKINALEPSIKALSDAQLQAKTPEFKERLAKGESLDSILPEAFAVCREAAWRVIGQRHYDVQMIGGITLHRGRIAEMRTGEGKTLVATLPSYLNALTGKGVHVITVNDYLARRDSSWMGQIHRFLGLSTGLIVHGLTDAQRKQSYGCDITYGTNNEFGFDYLRDNMKFRLEDYVQRELNFAIVDEVDSILIDEARTPLIISGPTDDSSELYNKIDKIVRQDGGLTKDTDYTIDEKSKTAALTEAGVDKIEARLGISNIYDPTHIETLHHVHQALRAHVIFKRDVDYVVQDGEVMIVDEFTGRLMPGRRWSDGLHQAIEAKEGVKIENENQTLATITFQNYFRMYNKLGGMTGTADTEATEFKQIYKLDVTVVPTNRAMVRQDMGDLIFKNTMSKFKAIAQQIKELNAKGQPVLVGTVSVEKSELISALLKREGVKHNVLNAKNHEREAEIVAQAGRLGAVTIATNMAGRGTDILLGGDPEKLARAEVGNLPRTATEEEHKEHEKKFEETLARWKKDCEAQRDQVKAAGGLFILGTERHESRRIDNQLRGRAGRQGDPGASRFYLSFEDDLLRIFGQSQMLQATVKAMEEDQPIEHRWTTKAIENAQKKVEGHNYDIRKHLLEYDDVMNSQRKVVYAWRKEVLARDNLKEMVFSMIGEAADALADEYFPGGKPRRSQGSRQLDMSEINNAIRVQWGVDLELKESEISPLSDVGFKKLVMDRATALYNQKESALSETVMRQLEKMVLLSTIDHLWKDHLLAMDHLREGIGLQGYGQKDPLIAYKKEGFRFFGMMMTQITGDVVKKLFTVQLAPTAALSEYEQELAEEEAAIRAAHTNESADGGLAPQKGQMPLPQGQPGPAGGFPGIAPGMPGMQRTPAPAGARPMPRPAPAGASNPLGGMMRHPPRNVTLSRGPMGGGLSSPVPAGAQAGGGFATGPASVEKVGRNDPCPCGSGKKYKKCHGTGA